MKLPTLPSASSRKLVGVALAGLAPSATAQWEPVEAPSVATVTALSMPRTGLVHAALETPGSTGVHGAGWASSATVGASWRRSQSPRTPVLVEIEPHPSDPDVLWGAYYSVWKSEDAGKTWTDSSAGGPNGITKLAVDPSSPERVYGVGEIIVPGPDFHRSTDGGATWVSSNPLVLELLTDVLVVPASGAVLLASSAGIHRSSDGGESFVKVAGGLFARRLEASVGSSPAIWCLAQETNGSTELFTSRDGGATWEKKASPAVDLTAVAPQPNDAARAYAVGHSGAYWTDDGGSSWNAGDGVSPIADLRSLSVSATEPDTVLAGGTGGFGGVWRSDDGGRTWSPAGEGLGTPVPELVFSPSGEAWAAGLGVPLRRQADGSWQPIDFAGGTDSTATSFAVDPSDPSRTAWVLETLPWFEYDHLIVGTGDGSTWTDATPPAAQDSTWEVRRVAFDETGTLYAGCQFGDLYRSADLGQSWTKYEGPWDYLEQLSVDPHDAARLYAIDQLAFHRSEDGGATWTTNEIGGLALPQPTDLFVDPGTAGRLLVIAGQSDRSLYESVDAGETWTTLRGGLPPLNGSSLAVDASRPSRVLVGTEQGAFLSLDAGASFAPFDAGLDHPVVTTVAFEPLTGRAWLSDANGGLYVRTPP